MKTLEALNSEFLAVRHEVALGSFWLVGCTPALSEHLMVAGDEDEGIPDEEVSTRRSQNNHNVVKVMLLRAFATTIDPKKAIFICVIGLWTISSRGHLPV